MKRDLIRLTENRYDLLIIGGGVYGLFVAWDAALRGLSAALVDKGDFGHATSANSSRVIHGGLRYLQSGDIRRVWHSSYERMTLMRIAPHLVHPLPFLIPSYGRGRRGKQVFSLALLVNDVINSALTRLGDSQKRLPPSRIISKKECLRLIPGIEDSRLTGGAIFYDGQMANSERFVCALARSAAQAGADLANYIEVTGLIRKGDRVIGARAQDVLTGDTLEIRAKLVINASGPWLGRVLRLMNGDRPSPRLILSKAFNVVVNRQLIPDYAIGLYSRSRFNTPQFNLRQRSRLLFIIPWHTRSLVGTEHLPYGGDPDGFEITEEEIQGFLDQINATYPAANLKRQDVCFVYGGLVPITANDDAAGQEYMAQSYRIVDHQKEDRIEGLITVLGVKLTEARYVAGKTIDLVFRKFGQRPPKSATAITPLHGGQIERFDDYLAQQIERRPHGLSAGSICHLVRHYGSAYPEVLKYLAPDCQAHSFSDSSEVLKAEVIHAIREEMAQTLSDVIFRRTGLALAGDPGDDSLLCCAVMMAQELNWNQNRMSKELEGVRAAFSCGAAYV